MSIFLGEATQQGTSFTITPPRGFNGVEAVRLTNYTGEVLILSNISGVGQNDEYLMPLQQMVYHTANVSNVPQVKGTLLGNPFLTSALFVEWSDDAEQDFIGTYPVTLSQVEQSSNPQPVTIDATFATSATPTDHVPLVTVSGVAQPSGWAIPDGQKLFLSTGILNINNTLVTVETVTVQCFRNNYVLPLRAVADNQNVANLTVTVNPPTLVMGDSTNPLTFVDLTGTAGVGVTVTLLGGLLPG